MIQKWKLMLARFPGSGSERTEIVDWVAAAVLWARKQPDIDGDLLMWSLADTPVTMSRNRAVKVAIDSGADILIMLDSDMAPDIDKAHPFLPSAFKFIKSRWATAPTIISAPYLTGQPSYNPVMGLWRQYHNGFQIAANVYSREEAEAFRGIQPCDLQGTGLMCIDMRIFTGFELGEETIKLPPPWFYYEFTDEYNTHKASTEDMVFTRNATLLFGGHGLKIGYVDWDAWAYHVKTEHIGKPHTLTMTDMAAIRKE